MKKQTKIFLGIIAVLVGIQLIPIDRTHAPVEATKNFVTIENTPREIQTLIKNACYDCHSNEVKYPWYAYIAPISWSVKNHINEGQEHLNFSEWGTYNKELKKRMMQKSVEEVENRKMPLSGYLPLHPEARLTAEQRQMMIQYFQQIEQRN